MYKAGAMLCKIITNTNINPNPKPTFKKIQKNKRFILQSEPATMHDSGLKTTIDQRSRCCLRLVFYFMGLTLIRSNIYTVIFKFNMIKLSSI